MVSWSFTRAPECFGNAKHKNRLPDWKLLEEDSVLKNLCAKHWELHAMTYNKEMSWECRMIF